MKINTGIIVPSLSSESESENEILPNTSDEKQGKLSEARTVIQRKEQM